MSRPSSRTQQILKAFQCLKACLGAPVSGRSLPASTWSRGRSCAVLLPHNKAEVSQTSENNGKVLQGYAMETKRFLFKTLCGHSTREGSPGIGVWWVFSPVYWAPLKRYIIFVAEFHILQCAQITWCAASTMPLVVRVHCRPSNEPAIPFQHAQHHLLNHAFQEIKIQWCNTAHDTKPLFKHERANCFYNLQARTIFASHVHAISSLKVSYPPCNMELDPWKSLMTIQLVERKSFPNTLRMLAKYLYYFHVYTLHYTVLLAYYTN